MKDILFKVLMLKGDAGEPTDEQTLAAVGEWLSESGNILVIPWMDTNGAGAIGDWLDDHPEATTTVLDGSLTESKFSNALKLKTIKDYVTPEMFGAVGDGTTDDTQAWKDAIASGKPILAVNNYLTVEQLSLDNDVYMLGTIYNDVSSAIKIQGKTAKTYILKVSAKQQNSEQFVGIDVVDSNNCQFSIKTRNFYIGTRFRGYSGGCAYNYIEKIFNANSKYFLLLQAENVGWCNENYFYNGRFIGETGSLYQNSDYGITIEKVSGTHDPNSNHFINFCAEGSYCAVHVLNYSRENSFRNIRTEGCTYACNFEVNTLWNIYEQSYNAGIVINDGTNYVCSMSDIVKEEVSPFLIATTGNLACNTASNTSATAPNVYRVSDDGTVRGWIYPCDSVETGIKLRSNQALIGFWINVKDNHVIKVFPQVTGNHRIMVVPFDENGAFMENVSIKHENAPFYKTQNSYVGKVYSMGTDLTTPKITFVKLDESIDSAFIGVSLESTDTIVHKIDLYGLPSNYEKVSSPLPMLSAVPTSNGYYINQTVYSSSENKKWVWDGSTWVEKTV